VDMFGWIVGEILPLDQPARPTWVEVVYLVVGLIMVLPGLVVGRHARSQKPYSILQAH
jgi:hypothetical protein